MDDNDDVEDGHSGEDVDESDDDNTCKCHQ